MRQAQHLALLQPVSTLTAGSAYTTTLTLPRQGAALIILGVNRPVTGRNGLATIEGEDYDGQSGVTREDSNDVDLGQSIAGNSGSSAFFDVVDFSDAGAGAVQLRVNAQAATSLELHADSPTGALVGRCAVAATGGAWATQSCALTRTSGVHTLYVLFGGTVRLNWVLFQAGSVATGTGGAGGGGTTGGSGGGPGGATGAGGAGAGGGNGAGGAGGGSSGSGGSGTGGMVLAGSGGSGSGGSGSGIGGASAGSGGSSPPGGGGGSGCACGVGDAGGRSAASAIVALVALLAARRRRRDV
jgi:MYXO-CTERM domain-containing protein